jgi:gluconate 5-dehydrogenase
MTMEIDNPFSLKGRVALVTGATQGLGFAMARSLGQAGATVYLNGRESARAEDAAGRLAAEGLAAFPCAFDVSDEAAMTEGLRAIGSRSGRLDILVNNVGARMRRPTSDIARADFNWLLDVNLTAAFLLSRAAAEMMRVNAYGRIIMVTSIGASLGIPGDVAYVAGKGGMCALTRALAAEYARDGITCNAISPGCFATETNAGLVANERNGEWLAKRAPIGRWGDPAEIGPTCVYFAAPASGFVTGCVLPVDGGLSSFMGLA